MTGSSTKKDFHSLSFVVFLVITAILSGALVMVIEVLGSKVLSPFFGASLFVWTSLITVTLVALAAGYAAGGLFSDKKSHPVYLYGIIAAAGFLVLLIPYAKGIVLKTCMALGLRSGSLASAAILFGPSLFLLGCVSPFIVKIAVREMHNVGRTVGLFYAISTLGSFLGTVLTGFVLIAYFSVDRIFEFVGASLICLAISYFVFFGKKWYLSVIIIFLPFFFHGHVPVQKIRPSGTKVTEVFSTDSFYGNLKVVDYSFEDEHTRELMIDGLLQSSIDLGSRASVFVYPYFMEFLPYAFNPHGQSCLVLGLGAGIIPMWYEERGITTDTVDINPKVVEIAEKYFGFKSAGNVSVSDARYYLVNTKKKYDYIIVDVASGDVNPGHIFSLESFELLRGRLTDKGILAINLIGSTTKYKMMTASILKTIKAAFNVVKVYLAALPEGEGVKNLAVIAYNDAALHFDPDLIKAFVVHPYAEPVVSKMMGKEFVFSDDTPSIILTDNYNPIDFFDVWVKEQIRKQSLFITDWELLI